MREYDGRGNVIRSEAVVIDVDGHDQAAVDDATWDLTDQGAVQSQALRHLNLGINITGAKTQPDNTDSFLFFGFQSVIMNDQVRKWCGFAPIIEVGRPWRRGIGYVRKRHGGFSVITGIWIPSRRPKRPKITKMPERMDISPAKLLG